MDGVNEPDENGKISNLLDPDVVKQAFGRKSQNWPNLRDEHRILLYLISYKIVSNFIRSKQMETYSPAPAKIKGSLKYCFHCIRHPDIS
ncbi:hypothetical protein Hanom_Chr06g00500281 [Helianthus anomalus]